MLHTYRAILNGDRLEWSDETPPVVEGHPVAVYVPVLEDTTPTTERSRGQQMADALERLAEMQALANKGE